MTPRSVWIAPVVLEGESARLEPLEEAHFDGLFAVALHEEIWRWMPKQVERPDDMRDAMDFGFQLRRGGTGQAFAIRELSSGALVGSTAYLNADEANRRVEFKTDSNNTQSRTAIVRLGAVEEGTFRNHVVREDGTLRHSVYFSVTVEEWPEVERRLMSRLTEIRWRGPCTPAHPLR